MVAACFIGMITTSANAWLIDGEDYIGLNSYLSEGKIDSKTFTTQAIGIEIGRNFTQDWYAGLTAEYIVYNINNSTFNEKALNGIDVLAKIGYKPTSSTTLYGLSGVAEQGGIIFGGGFRWDMFENAGVFVEGRKSTVTANEKNYKATHALGGISLFLRY